MEDEILRRFVKGVIEWKGQENKAKLELDMQEKIVQTDRKIIRQSYWQGIQQALREGRQDIAKLLVRDMERQGISAEEIAGDTGLTPEEVGKLLLKAAFTQEERQAKV